MNPFIINLLAGLRGLFNRNKLAISSILAVAILFLFNLRQCGQTAKLRKQLAVSEQNIKALNDTIRVTKERNGDTEYNKLALLTDNVKDLQKLSADLAAEVRNIKGHVSTIIKGDVKLVHDTVPLIVQGEILNSVAVAHFNYDSVYSPGNSRKLSGYTNYDLVTGQVSGKLTQDETTMRFKVGIKNLDKGKPEIFLQSDHPGFSVSALDGAVLDPHLFSKKPHTPLLTLGVGIGYTPLTYDWVTKKATFNFHQLGATIGVNVNIIKLLKHKN